jgi:hypothetical protein
LLRPVQSARDVGELCDRVQQPIITKKSLDES